MSNILKFPKSGSHAGPTMTQQQAIQLYSAMMNLYSAVNVSSAANRDLLQFLVNAPGGLPAGQTLTAASMISKNVDLMQNMQQAVATMMRFLMEQSSISMADVIFQDQPQAPDDHPPAA